MKNWSFGVRKSSISAAGVSNVVDPEPHQTGIFAEGRQRLLRGRRRLLRPRRIAQDGGDDRGGEAGGGEAANQAAPGDRRAPDREVVPWVVVDRHDSSLHASTRELKPSILVDRSYPAVVDR
jgi:hypothetical protein